MSKQIFVVLDNPPLEHDRWADEVMKRAKLAPISNSEVSDAMAADEATLKVLLAHADNPMRDAEELAPCYRKAFDKLYHDVTRAGLYGTAWLVYAPQVDACIVDWSEVDRRATAPGTSEPEGRFFRTQSMEFVHARVKKHLDPERLLELSPGLSPEERIEQSVAFLQKLGLC